MIFAYLLWKLVIFYVQITLVKENEYEHANL